VGGVASKMTPGSAIPRSRNLHGQSESVCLWIYVHKDHLEAILMVLGRKDQDASIS
jgi:hypothetical protein